MFVDEDQWARAYQAAKAEVALIFSNGDTDNLPALTVTQQNELATRIATAALRAAAQDEEGDISDLPGVRIVEIDGSTTSLPGRSGNSPL